MPKKTAIDSGPLIALFDKDDHYHQQAIAFSKHFQGEFVSTIAVITEVTHLLDFNVQAQTDFILWAAEGGLTLFNPTAKDLFRIATLVKKYANLPMDFADATIVVMCERLKITEVVSVDRDFYVYRMEHKTAFHNIFFA